MPEKKVSFEDSEAQSFISASDSDVTAGWGSTKYELEKSHTRTIRIYKVIVGLLVSVYIVSAAFVAWRARSNAGTLPLRQQFMGHSESLHRTDESLLMERPVPTTLTTFHNDEEYVEGKFNGIWGDYMVRT